jgi:hypothetical protein
MLYLPRLLENAVLSDQVAVKDFADPRCELDHLYDMRKLHLNFRATHQEL